MIDWCAAGRSGRSHGGCFVIAGITIRQLAALIAVAVLVGATAGVAGGIVGANIAGDDLPEIVRLVPPAPESPPPTTAERLRAAIETVSPAVVTVLTTQGQSQNQASGIVISDGGYVLTNYHVIEDAESVVVVLSTGERRDALFVGDDSPYSDVAVLRIAPEGLRSARFGDSDLVRRGDTVVVIAGGLLTFENAVKVGVISQVRLDWARDGVINQDMLQTDAAVNHGDSGGALINLDGEVIGLLSQVIRVTPDGQIVEGLALAHSSNSIAQVIEAFVTAGRDFHVRPGIERIGRQHLEITPALAAERGLPVDTGALVVAVEPGSPAARAGVTEGDIVVGVNGVAIDLNSPFVNLLKELTPGIPTELFILRGDEQLIVVVAT